MYFRELFKIRKSVWPLTKDRLDVDWDKVESIPEFARLKNTKQSSVWHKEGDAFAHTRLVTEAMKSILKREGTDAFSERWLMMMSAALCHDLGKTTTTSFDKSKNDWACKKHGAASATIIRSLFQNEDIGLREAVCFMARHHMTLHHIFDKPERTDRSLIALQEGPVALKDMILLNEADSTGSKNEKETTDAIAETTEKIKAAAERLGILDLPYPFKNEWHRLEYFLNPEIYARPDDVDVPAESFEPKFTVYIMVGVPGAGKDYYIEHNLKGIPVLSRDTIRTEIGLTGEKPQGNREQEQKVTDIFSERMDALLERRESFIINNTNCDRRYRDGFARMAIDRFAKVVFIYCEAPTIDDNFRRRKGMMPMNVITRMWNGLEFPDMTECGELKINISRP